MIKEKRILSNYIGWLILGLIICFVGIKNTYASEISGFDFMGKDFNSFWIEQNSSTSGTLSVTVSDITQIKPYINIIMASTFEPNFVVTSNNYFTDTWTRKLYSYGTTTILGYTANVYVIQFSTKGLNNWNCSVDGTNCYVNTNIRMTGSADYSAVFQLRSISLTDSVLDDDYLKNITVNQNNEIIDQNQTIIDQNQSIINGQDNIINNQNQNNEKLIEELKKGQLTCGYNYKEEFKYSNLQNQGAIAGGIIENNSNFKYSEPTIIFGGYEYDVSGYNIGSSNRYLIAVYDSDMNYLFDFNYKNNTILDLSNYDGILYIIANVNNNQENDLVIVQKNGICVPTSYLQMKQNQETNDKLNNIEGALTDDSSIDISGLEDSIGWLPPGPVDSIINLPLSLFNSLSYNLSNNTCISASLPLPFVNKNISLPCVKSLYEKIGITGTLFQSAGLIASCFILFNYLLNLYHWVDNTLTLRENTMPGYYDDNWGGGA